MRVLPERTLFFIFFLPWSRSRSRKSCNSIPTHTAIGHMPLLQVSLHIAPLPWHQIVRFLYPCKLLLLVLLTFEVQKPRQLDTKTTTIGHMPLLQDGLQIAPLPWHQIVSFLYPCKLLLLLLTLTSSSSYLRKCVHGTRAISGHLLVQFSVYW